MKITLRELYAVRLDNVSDGIDPSKINALKATDINWQDKHGDTLLHTASRHANVKHIKQLLKMGANPSLLNRAGNTPLHLLCTRGTIEGLDALIKAGADVNATNIIKLTPLMFAAVYNNIECMNRLLSARADVNAVTVVGQSALILAAGDNNIEAVLLLLRLGAQPEQKDSSGKTYLVYLNAEDLSRLKELLNSGKSLSDAMIKKELCLNSDVSLN